MITVFTGGTGGTKLVQGLQQVLSSRPGAGSEPEAERLVSGHDFSRADRPFLYFQSRLQPAALDRLAPR